MEKLIALFINQSIGDTHCQECGCSCQGWKDPSGRILCWDCFVKIWGCEPTRWI